MICFTLQYFFSDLFYLFFKIINFLFTSSFNLWSFSARAKPKPCAAWCVSFVSIQISSIWATESCWMKVCFICFQFMFKINFKLDCCTHIHSGVKWGQDSVLFPLSVFQTWQLELHLLPLTPSKWKKVKQKPQSMQLESDFKFILEKEYLSAYTHL